VIGEIQRDAAVAIAERLDADPDDFAGGGERVEIGGIVASMRAGRISRLEIDAGSGAPCSCSIASSSASRPRARATTPCQVVTKRPSTA
jgi:hypothetical protein